MLTMALRETMSLVVQWLKLKFNTLGMQVRALLGEFS